MSRLSHEYPDADDYAAASYGLGTQLHTDDAERLPEHEDGEEPEGWESF